MTEVIYPDLQGDNPNILVLFDKFEFEDVKAGKPFSNPSHKRILKEITNRGFKSENLLVMNMKNTVVYDNEGNLEVYKDPEDTNKKSKGRIIITDKDKEQFKNRLLTLSLKFDFKAVFIFGKEVAYALQEMEMYKVGECEQQAKKILFLGDDCLVIETISPLEYSLSMSGRNKVLNALDQIYSSLYEITSVDNASFVSLDTFSGYLNKLMILYDNKMIDCIGFDYETNGPEWSEPWAKLIAVSISDRFTKHAFSCALYHPEVILHPRKKTLLKWLFSQIYSKIKETNEEYITLGEKLEKFTKIIYPKLEGLPYKEVFNDDEYFLLESLPSLIKIFKKKTSKSFEEKCKAHEEFKNLILEQTKRLMFLIQDETYKVKLQEFYLLLDKVLSKIPVVGHNVKFDIGWCAKMCIGLKNLKVKADTFGQAVALMGQEFGEKKDLETLSIDILNIENKWKSAFHSSPRLGHGVNMRFDRVPLKILGPYSAADAITTDLLDEHFSKLMEGKAMNLVEKEQNIAIVMFSLGEVHGFSVHPETCTKLYKYVNNNLEALRTQLINFPMVKKFVEDRRAELPEDKKELFVFNTNTSGAQSHNAAVLFRKEYYGLTSLKSTDAGYPSADADTLKEIKKQIEKSLKEYEEKKEGEIVLCDNNNEIITEKNYPILKEAMEFCNNLIQTSGFAQLNNMYYKVSYDEKNDKPLDKFIAVFKLVGATKTGRLSSRFHLAPKTGGVRYVYCSAWSKDNIRKYQFKHVPGVFYEPLYGLLDIEYEDGTKEKVSYDELLKRGYTVEEIEQIYNNT